MYRTNVSTMLYIVDKDCTPTGGKMFVGSGRRFAFRRYAEIRSEQDSVMIGFMLVCKLDGTLLFGSISQVEFFEPEDIGADPLKQMREPIPSSIINGHGPLCEPKIGAENFSYGCGGGRRVVRSTKPMT